MRETKQGGILGKMCLVRPLRVNYFLKKRQGYMWYQVDIYLAKNRLVGTLKSRTTGGKKLKDPNTINDTQ